MKQFKNESLALFGISILVVTICFFALWSLLQSKTIESTEIFNSEVIPQTKRSFINSKTKEFIEGISILKTEDSAGFTEDINDNKAKVTTETAIKNIFKDEKKETSNIPSQESKTQSILKEPLQQSNILTESLTVSEENYAAPHFVDESWTGNPLFWLKQYQEKDGSWRASRWVESSSSLDDDLLATSASLLIYAISGHNMRVGRYRRVVKNGFLWLSNQQRKDGSWSDSEEVNLFCTMFFTEVLCMGYSEKGIPAEQLIIVQKSYEAISRQIERTKFLQNFEKDYLKKPFLYYNFLVYLNTLKALETEKEKVAENHQLLSKKILTVIEKKDYKNEVMGNHFQDRLLLATMCLIANAEYHDTLWIQTLADELPYLEMKSYENMDIVEEYFLSIFVVIKKEIKASTLVQKKIATLTSAIEKEGINRGSFPMINKTFLPSIDRISSTLLAASCLELYYRYYSVPDSH